jgi:periplasmic divalent cation tolerance protein
VKVQSEKSGYVVVFITTATAEEAQRIANILVSGRKAACVNIVPQVHSRFWWQGQIDSADEVLLIVKTREALLDELIGLVKENHSYEVPEIVALPIVGGNPDYLQWLDDETEKKIHVD